MSMPRFEHKAGPPRETPHPDSNYNSKDENINRSALKKAHEGRNAYVPIEEVEGDEQDIYDHVDKSLEKGDIDEFGYIDMMNRIIGKLNDKEKDKFLDNGSVFLPLHRDIINDENLSDEEKDKLLREKFTQIFGHQVLSYDVESGVTDMNIHKKGFIRIKDKATPSHARVVEYANIKGRSVPVDPDAPKATKEKDRGSNNYKSKFKSLFSRNK